MAAPTLTDYENFKANLDRLDIALNGDETSEVVTNLQTKYPSLAKAMKMVIQNSLIKSEPFSTLAELNANQTLAEGSFGFVYADSDSNNGLYSKNNGAWLKSPFSPISFDISSINIFDKSNLTPKSYVDYTSGGLVLVNGFTSSAYLKVEPNTVYKASSFYSQQFAFFDNEFTYISGLPTPDAKQEFTTPPNAAYARFTIKDTWVDTLVIAKKDEFPKEYQPYTPRKTINGLQVNPSQLVDFLPFLKNSLNITAINIMDTNGLSDGYYVDFMGGNLAPVSGYLATSFLPVKPNTVYRVSDFYPQQFAFFDNKFTYISGLPTPGANHEFTTPANAAYARFTVRPEWLPDLVIAEKALFPSEYVSPDKFILPGLYVPSDTAKNNVIWVSADTNDADQKVRFKGNNAIQNALDSITDASPTNRYTIRVKQGLYKITKATDFLGYPGYPAMVLTKDHVDIIGQGENNTIVWAALPYNDDDIGPSADGKTYPRGSYQTVYDYSGDSKLKDITFVGENLRYTIHIDNPKGADKTRNFDNVRFLFKGNKGSLNAMGCGTSSGERTYINGGVSSSDSNVAFASHNNIAFETPSLWSFKNHSFITLSQPYSIYLQNDGSLVQDQLELEGCSFGGMGYILGYVDVWLSSGTGYKHDSFNHAEWMITGHGNEPFLFENTVAGKSLLLKTTNTGTGATIRFDTNSSAYPILVKNNRANAASSIYADSREFMDGYIIQDGSPGLPAKAWGCLDLSETIALYNGTTNYTSLATRLGNRSSAPITLGVVINGVTNNIVFNKDYTGLSNAQIIAEMQAQLTGASIELISYGRDYYPTITDVCETAYNNGQTYIPKGSLVTKQNGFIRLATNNDVLFGVALDDVPVMAINNVGIKKGQGRVLKKGYINTNSAAAHFIRCDYPNAPVGTKFSINNGSLVTDQNGKITVAIANGLVSINC